METLAGRRATTPARRVLKRLHADHGDDLRALLHVIRDYEALEERTEGNPLFVSEIVRIMLGDACSSAHQSGFLTRSPTACRKPSLGSCANALGRVPRALDTAAILGRDVHLDVLTALTEDADVLLDALDEAVAGGILTRVPGATGDLRFSHVLVRDALYDRLPTTTRGRADLRAAAVIETLRASDLGPHRSEIADHHVAAGPVAAPRSPQTTPRSPARPRGFARDEEAIRWFSAALELIERVGADEGHRLDLLLPLGEAELRAGDLSSAHATFRSAAEIGGDSTARTRARACSGTAVVSRGFEPAPTPFLSSS